MEALFRLPKGDAEPQYKKLKSKGSAKPLIAVPADEPVIAQEDLDKVLTPFGVGRLIAADKEEEKDKYKRVALAWGAKASVIAERVLPSVDLSLVIFSEPYNGIPVQLSAVPIAESIAMLKKRITKALSLDPSFPSADLMLSVKGTRLSDDRKKVYDFFYYSNCILAGTQNLLPPLLCIIDEKPNEMLKLLLRSLADNVLDAGLTKFKSGKPKRQHWEERWGKVSDIRDLRRVLEDFEAHIPLTSMSSIWEVVRREWASNIHRVSGTAELAAWIWFFARNVKAEFLSEAWRQNQYTVWWSKLLKLVLKDRNGLVALLKISAAAVEDFVKKPLFSSDWISSGEYKGDVAAILRMSDLYGDSSLESQIADLSDGCCYVLSKIESSKLTVPNGTPVQSFFPQTLAELSDYLSSIIRSMDAEDLTESWAREKDGWLVSLEKISAIEATLPRPAPPKPNRIFRVKEDSFRMNARAQRGDSKKEDSLTGVLSSLKKEREELQAALDDMNGSLNRSGLGSSSSFGSALPSRSQGGASKLIESMLDLMAYAEASQDIAAAAEIEAMSRILMAGLGANVPAPSASSAQPSNPNHGMLDQVQSEFPELYDDQEDYNYM